MHPKKNKTNFRAKARTQKNSALWQVPDACAHLYHPKSERKRLYPDSMGSARSKLEGVHSKLAEKLELILVISIQLLDFIGCKKRKKKKKKTRDKKHFASQASVSQAGVVSFDQIF